MRELFILTPNRAVSRVSVQSCPFSTELVADCADDRWLYFQPTRFYLYPVHVSRTFLLSPTLSSSLYLVLLRVLSRQYAEAFRLIAACQADLRFSDEEAYVACEQFEALNNDSHPDCVACKLKLSLVTMHSGEMLPWSVGTEYATYAQKLSHVSSQCRLSVEEELLLMQTAFSKPPPKETELECRLRYLTQIMQLKNGKSNSDSKALQQLEGLKPKPGLAAHPLRGAPWLTLLSRASDWYAQTDVATPRQRPKDKQQSGSGSSPCPFWQETLYYNGHPSAPLSDIEAMLNQTSAPLVKNLATLPGAKARSAPGAKFVTSPSLFTVIVSELPCLIVVQR